jgi:hypothetical protein
MGRQAEIVFALIMYVLRIVREDSHGLIVAYDKSV